MSPSTTKTTFGQVIEYIPERLYLASYTSPPDASTVFPFDGPKVRSPSKRSARAHDGPAAVDGGKERAAPYYFTIDDQLLYNAFHHDFGPLHIGHLYRFAVMFHDILSAPENKGRPVVFWSRADARSRANASCMLACYMVLIQSWAPHLALAPIAQADPPLMPFRDAGYSQADYGITIQDVVYGVWRAKEEGFCDLNGFELEEYERYERVDQGDFNWLTPHFLAFASPQHTPTAVIDPSSPLWATLPTTLKAVDAHPTLPTPFKNVLKHFSQRNIGLVVRLNSELYSPSYFEALGIKHIDMIFDDGTCPPLSMVRRFLTMAHEMITKQNRGIAVHCKAGLGRTGCLIGAYLIYRYGFTANEIIAYMRFMRPGMVVGPQQHWLHLNQGTFRKWWEREQCEKELREKIEAEMKAKYGTHRQENPTTPHKNKFLGVVGSAVSTPLSKRTPLGEVDNERTSIGVQEDCLPAPTPGQPRKASRVGADRQHPYPRSGASASHRSGDDAVLQRETETINTSRRSENYSSEEEREWQLRMRTRKVSSRSPAGRESKRQVSSTTTTVYETFEDVENTQQIVREKSTRTGTRSASGSGNGAALIQQKMRGSASPKRSATVGVRKVSKGTSGERKGSGL